MGMSHLLGFLLPCQPGPTSGARRGARTLGSASFGAQFFRVEAV